VTWDTHVHAYRVRLRSDRISVEIRRTQALKPVAALVEKRLRGDRRPLARERHVVTAHSRVQKAGDRRKRIRIARGPCDLMPAIIFRPPAGPQRWTLIYLHGMGSSALGNYAERPHYFYDGSVALKVVVPTSPSREVSCFDTWWYKSRGNWHMTKFRSWYDYLSNHDGAKEDAIDIESLLVVQRAMHSLIRQEARELGASGSSRIILGGKSQGCCTALDAAFSYPEPLGGFIGLVGHLLSCTPVEPNGPQRQMPLHFFHEPNDRTMRWEWVSKAEQRIRKAGYTVHSRRLVDPEGHGHYIEGVEGAWIRSALRHICGAA